jgi:hypothetical protein
MVDGCYFDCCFDARYLVGHLSNAEGKRLDEVTWYGLMYLLSTFALSRGFQTGNFNNERIFSDKDDLTCILMAILCTGQPKAFMDRAYVIHNIYNNKPPDWDHQENLNFLNRTWDALNYWLRTFQGHFFQGESRQVVPLILCLVCLENFLMLLVSAINTRIMGSFPGLA